MYTIVLLSTIVAVAVAHPDMKCAKIFNPETVECCPKLADADASIHAGVEECLDGPPNPHSCDPEICIAKKKGFLSGISSYDKAALLKTLEKDYEDQKELIETLKARCIDGNIDKYGRPDTCDLVKLSHCLKMVMLVTCPEWKDTDDCKDKKELVLECDKKAA